MYRVSDIDALEELMKQCQLTHLITGQAEYREYASYFEYLDKSIEMIVVAGSGFVPPRGSRVKIFRKPFYAWPIVSKLNARVSRDIDPFDGKRRMICPDVSALVVDDEPMNLMVAEGLLRDYQMRVKTARSGMDAAELCKQEEFDLIFLDHMMPEMDGVETLKRLRQIYMDAEKAPAVIAFTANAVSGAREMFLREGFSEFVSKPIEGLALERVLREVLPRSAIRYLDDEHAEREAGMGDVSPEASEPRREDRLASLEDAGIHTWSGIQYCRGDSAFYQELLVKFARNESRTGPKLDELLRREDLETYRITVHSLKSSAKTVGADLLSELAKQAEDAAKNGDAAYIRAHHGALISSYHTLAQVILRAFDQDRPVPEDARERTVLSKDELVRELTRLQEKLSTFEEESSAALLDQMGAATYLGTPVRQLLAGVRQDVEDFEFSAASEKVAALLRKIESGEVG